MTTLYRDLRPAQPASDSHLAGPAGPAGEERRPCFLVGRLKSALPRPCRGAGGGDWRDSFRMAAPLPALELAGRSPAVRRVLGSLPEYAPQVERLERAGRLERGRLTRGAVDRPVWAAGAHVRLPDGQVQVLPLLLLHALRPPGGAPEACRIHMRRSTAPSSTMCWSMCSRSCRHRGGELGGGAAEAAGAAVRAAVDRYTAEELGGLEHQSQRFRYLFRRLLQLRPGGGGQRGPGAVRLPIPAHFL